MKKLVSALSVLIATVVLAATAMPDLLKIPLKDINGKPRTFSSFTAAGQENADSRVYLGVHYPMDCTEGTRIGKLVAQRVNELKWKK